MTPKEKANELVKKLINHSLKESVIENGELYYTQVPSAKQCAIICVDEILETNPFIRLNGGMGESIYKIKEATTYWQSVKQEIELL